MKYDPEAAPDPEKWLVIDETQRIELVSAYHLRLDAKLPNAHLHAAIHTIVENQLAQEVDLTKDALVRLCAEGPHGERNGNRQMKASRSSLASPRGVSSENSMHDAKFH